MLISRTPYRISLAGGGTDFPEWFKYNPASVISGTINKYSFITCRKLERFFEHNYRIVYSLIENVLEVDDIRHPAVKEIIKTLNCKHGLEIHHDGDLPARTGLGSSSAFSVGLVQLISRLMGNELGKRELAEIAIDIERNKLKENVGLQDQIACSYGGLNKIFFYYENEKPEFKVEQIIVNKDVKLALQKQIVLVYTGKQRFSSQISSKLVKNLSSSRYLNSDFMKKNNNLVSILEKILNGSENINTISDVFEESWQIKKYLNPDSITQELEHLKEFGIKNGAKSAKILGAGGGGFVAFWTPNDVLDKFKTAFNKNVLVQFEFEDEGSKIIYDSKSKT